MSGRAVLYVCVHRERADNAAAVRARAEGRRFAAERGLDVCAVVVEPYGTPNPQDRPGWRQVRSLAARRAIDAVIMRWPACIAPDSHHELRHAEIAALAEDGVRVLFSWAPLAAAPVGTQVAAPVAIQAAETETKEAYR